jgi:hypothetical protein
MYCCCFKKPLKYEIIENTPPVILPTIPPITFQSVPANSINPITSPPTVSNNYYSQYSFSSASQPIPIIPPESKKQKKNKNKNVKFQPSMPTPSAPPLPQSFQ